VDRLAEQVAKIEAA
jgi:transposase